MVVRGNRLKSVIVTEGLRFHCVPKVASTSILAAHIPPRRQAHPEEPGGEYRVMVVRHPLERLVSAYTFFLTSGAANELTQMGYKMGCDFGEFLKYVFEVHDANQHTRQQWLFAGPFAIDLLIPIHKLSDIWPSLMTRFSQLKPIEYRNKTSHDAWETYFTNDQRDQAETIFSADLQLYERAL